MKRDMVKNALNYGVLAAITVVCAINFFERFEDEPIEIDENRMEELLNYVEKLKEKDYSKKLSLD